MTGKNARAGNGWCVDCNCIVYAVGPGATTNGRGTTIARHKRFPVAAGEATAVAVARRSGRSARGQRDGLSPPRGHDGVDTAGCSVYVRVRARVYYNIVFYCHPPNVRILYVGTYYYRWVYTQGVHWRGGSALSRTADRDQCIVYYMLQADIV